MSRHTSERGVFKTLSVFFETRPLPSATFVAVVLVWFLQYTPARDFFLNGTLRDTDDAMRLTQLRDFVHGQGWFDLTQHRLNPPQGVPMHWSRLIDAALAGLIAVFSIFMTPALPETWAMLVWPALLQVLFFFSILKLTQTIAGNSALIPAAVVCGFQWLIASQFAPGRIDHHNVQITLCVLCVAATLASLQRPRAALLAGFSAAATIAIGFEALFTITLTALFFPLLWLAEGLPRARILKLFGTSLAAGSLGLYAVSIPPARYFDIACDAQSFATLAVAIVGSGLCFMLAAATPKLQNFRSRLAALCGAAIVLVACALPFAAACRTGPFGAIPPLVQTLWLDRVNEARGLLEHVRADPWQAPVYIALLLLGLMAAVAAFRLNPKQRWSFGLLFSIIIVQTVLTFNQVRAITLALVFALPCLAFCMAWLRPRTQLAMAALYVASLPLTWMLPSLAMAPKKPPPLQGCQSAPAYEAIKALPAGLAFAPIDLGPYLLAYTPHSAVGGPYHRNIAGLEFTLETMKKPPQDAIANLRARGVVYVFLCARSDVKALGKLMPGSFAEALAASEPLPSGLAKIPGSPALAGLTPIAIIAPMQAWRVD